MNIHTSGFVQVVDDWGLLGWDKEYVSTLTTTTNATEWIIAKVCYRCGLTHFYEQHICPSPTTTTIAAEESKVKWGDIAHIFKEKENEKDYNYNFDYTLF